MTFPRQFRETIITDPPSYSSSGYGAIEVHHHHHVAPGCRGARRASPCCRAILLAFVFLFIIGCFGALGFVAWNFYNLSECEKKRMPWDPPCKDWLGRDSHNRSSTSALMQNNGASGPDKHNYIVLLRKPWISRLVYTKNITSQCVKTS